MPFWLDVFCASLDCFPLERPSSKALGSHKPYIEETVNDLRWTRPFLFFFSGEKSGFKDPLHLGHLQSSIVTICAPVADRQRRSPSGWYTCKNLADLCALYSACYSVLLPFPIIFIFLLFLILSSSCKVTRDEKQKKGRGRRQSFMFHFLSPAKKKKKIAFSTRLEW